MSEAQILNDATPDVAMSPDEIKADVQRRLQAKQRGLPAWPSAMEKTHDFGLRAKYQDIIFVVDNLDKAHTEITQDERLSQQGKTEKLTELQQLALSQIESKNNTLSAEQNAAKLRNAIAAKTDAALHDAGRLARSQQVIQWLTALPPADRAEAWKQARLHDDVEFLESVALTSPTIRKVLMPGVADATLAEIKAQFSQRHATEETAELTTLTTEIDVLKKAVAAALHRARTKLHTRLN